MKNIILIMILSGLCSAQAKITYTYDKLKMRSVDQLVTMVEKQAEIADQEGTQGLERAMQIILSKPDDDGSLNVLYPKVRSELKDRGAYEKALEWISQESIDALKSNKEKTDILTTHTYILINLLSELKPMHKDDPASKKCIEKIRDAKIELSDKIAKELNWRGLKKLQSPSKLAASILPTESPIAEKK